MILVEGERRAEGETSSPTLPSTSPRREGWWHAPSAGPRSRTTAQVCPQPSGSSQVVLWSCMHRRFSSSSSARQEIPVPGFPPSCLFLTMLTASAALSCVHDAGHSGHIKFCVHLLDPLRLPWVVGALNSFCLKCGRAFQKRHTAKASAARAHLHASRHQEIPLSPVLLPLLLVDEVVDSRGHALSGPCFILACLLRATCSLPCGTRLEEGLEAEGEWWGLREDRCVCKIGLQSSALRPLECRGLEQEVMRVPSAALRTKKMK